VVFDLDGLLVDSEGVWGRAERAVVGHYDRPWDEAVRALLLGSGPKRAAELLAAHLDVADIAEVGSRLEAAAHAAFADGIDVRPGARRLVEALHGRVPLAVATNSSRTLAGRALASAGLNGLLPVVVSSDDVTAPKPSPEPYLAACGRLAADPSCSVAFEDSPVGLQAARAAGLWTVGCPSLAPLPPDAADALVATLDDVDPAVLLRGSG
jgi:HAD superfamily hydrolase (TIGR01509 family)